MAKNAKPTNAFGVDPESFNQSRRRTGSEPSEPVVTDYQAQEPKAKERKTKRVQLLTYESLIDRMDAYAARQGVNRVDVFEAAVTAFLDKYDV